MPPRPCPLRSAPDVLNLCRRIAVPRPRPPPRRPVLRLPVSSIIQAAPIQSDIRALGPLETQRPPLSLRSTRRTVGSHCAALYQVPYPILSYPPARTTQKNQFIPRAQTRISASGARSCFSSTTSSYPPSQTPRVLLPVREYAEATSKRDQLCTQTPMRRWWPTLRRPTQLPRRCAPCARTVCCLCSCGS